MDPDIQAFLREILEKQSSIENQINLIIKQIGDSELKNELKTIHVKVELIRQQLKVIEDSVKK